MRKHVLGLGILAVVAIAPAAAEAQATLGPTIAWHDDRDVGIGATFGVPVVALDPGIRFIGDFIFFFPGDDGLADHDYWEINGNLTYDFPLEESTAVPFVLAGLNIAHRSLTFLDGRDRSDTDVGLNVGGGITFDAGTFRPSLGGRFELGGGEGFVFFVTLPFELASN